MQGIEQLEKFQEFVSDIGGLGRYEDTYIVHAAEGETVVPMEVLEKNPVLKNRLFETMRDMGIQPERYIVGNEFNSINPITGQPEFFLKKIFKRLKKGVRDIGARLRKGAADISGYAAPIIGAMYGPLAGAGIGALLGQYKRENPGDPNQALKMTIRGGISGLTSNLAQGQNLLTGTGMSGGTIGQAGAFRNPFEIGREQLARFGIGDQQTANVNLPTDTQVTNAAYDPNDAMQQFYRQQDSVNPNLIEANFNVPTGTATDAVGTAIQELPKEGFLESLQYGGSKAYLNPLNILKNPGPNEIKEMFSFKDLLSKGFTEDQAIARVMDMYKLTPAKASAIAGAFTYGSQLLMNKLSGDEDDDDTTTAGFEINPILEGIFTGAPTGDLYYDYGSAVQAAEGGIMDLQDGGESIGPGTGTSDSIPAMLSDGEFVMTAKAVRGAGGGDRREGARKMYEAMAKLEAQA